MEARMETGTWKVKTGLAQMLKGGVIMDVVTAEHAKIAEDAGACSVMALERVPADIRAAGGVARMSDPSIIEEIMKAVSIPVMAKCRIGHFVEAQVLQSLGVDYIDESEVLTPADESHHIWKHDFKVPFVCGCRDLGEALRRIGEGAAMIRTKGEAGTGNIVEAVRHVRAVTDAVRKLAGMPNDELMAFAKEIGAPFEIVQEIHKTGKLPVVNFAAGGVATPADAALMMQLGSDGIFVGSGIFKSGDPAATPEEKAKQMSARAKAIVKATTHYQNPEIIAEVSRNLGNAMPGLDIKQIKPEDLLAVRGW
jgi:pyridoxal 5'-phosphate synthase pdxS subunit